MQVQLPKNKAKLPRFREMKAAEVLEIVAKASAKQRQAFVFDLLYTRSHRPRDVSEQQKVLAGILQLEGLAPHDRANALVALAHKSIELQDRESIKARHHELEQAFEDAAGLPWAGALRESRCHVTFSIGYVWLLACLFLDCSDFERAGRKIASAVRGLSAENLTRHFFRTSANITKSLGLLAAAAASRGDVKQVADYRTNVDGVLIVAIEALEIASGPWPPGARLRPTRMKRTGYLGTVELENQYREYFLAQSIRQFMNELQENNFRNWDSLVEMSVSHAVPGQAEDLTARFNAKFPRPQMG